MSTMQIEYATLNENVMGQMTLPGQDAAQPLNVLRRGTLEPTDTKPVGTKQVDGK
jgi:hypothetical protein